MCGISGFTLDGSPICTAVTAIIESLGRLVCRHGWRLRGRTANWVKWVPRERNQIADAFANHALDAGCAVAYAAAVLNLEDAWADYVIMSDGAYRAGTRRASAAWVILKFEQGMYTLVLGGAMLRNDCHDSMDAELRGLELATRAFMNFIRGSAEVIPHHVDRTLEQHELPNPKLLNM